MRGPEYDAEVAEAHRALGEFIDRFQLLCARLRNGTAVLASGNGPALVASRIEIALGGAGARMLCDGFFGVLRTYDRQSEADRAALRVLEREVVGLINTRNDMAHGDWFIGFAADGATRPDDPRLMRIKASRKQGSAEISEFSIERLRGLTADANRLSLGVQLGMIYALQGLDQTIAEVLPIVDGKVTPAWK